MVAIGIINTSFFPLKNQISLNERSHHSIQGMISRKHAQIFRIKCDDINKLGSLQTKKDDILITMRDSSSDLCTI